VIDYTTTKYKNNMSYIGVTRFTNETFCENLNYRKRHNIEHKYIYNSPVKISVVISEDSGIFVLEMNNSINKIMGVSYIINKVMGIRKYNMYMNTNYNRYCYETLERIDVNSMNIDEKNIIMFFEILCFKSKKHMKRGSGISCFNNTILKRCNNIIDLKKFIKNMFVKRNILV
jgi:hypothetical protein